MSTDLNAITSKIGDLNAAVRTAMSRHQLVTDAACQTLLRQKHLKKVATWARDGKLNPEETLREIDIINGRCPYDETLIDVQDSSHHLEGIVHTEFRELYELVEKLRTLAEATVDQSGEKVEIGEVSDTF